MSVTSTDEAEVDMELGDFFTNKEYVLQTHSYERITLQCYSLEMNTTDADLTGQVLWPGSDIMCRFLLAPFQHLCYQVPALGELFRHQSNTMFTNPCNKTPVQPCQSTSSCDNVKSVSSSPTAPDPDTCLCSNSNAQLSSDSNSNSSPEPTTTMSMPICTLCSHLEPSATTAASSSSESTSTPGSSVSRPPYTIGCHLLHSRRVLEFGSGYGMLGLFMARFAREVTMTDYKPEVLELLERNRCYALENPPVTVRTKEDGTVEQQRQLLSEIKIAKLLWGADVDLPPITTAANSSGSSSTSAPDSPASPPIYDILIGADIIYDGSVVPVLFSMIARYLTHSPHTIFLCSYITRWNVVDAELKLALERHQLESIWVPLAAFMPQPMPTKYQYGNMLLVWKGSPPVLKSIE